MIEELIEKMRAKEAIKTTKDFDEVCERYARTVLRKRLTVAEIKNLLDASYTSTATALEEYYGAATTQGTSEPSSRKPPVGVSILIGGKHVEN